MEHTLENPVVVEFPLRGEDWMAVTTPAHRVPSHGTDMLGQRYAYDFLKVDRRKGVHFHPASTLRGELFGGRTRESRTPGARPSTRRSTPRSCAPSTACPSGSGSTRPASWRTR